jgi:hypothetical protein
MILVTGSITPHTPRTPEVRYQPPSVLSLRSSANTVAPEDQNPRSPHHASARPSRRRLWLSAALATAVGAICAGVLRSEDVSPQVLSGSPGYRMSKSGKPQLWQKKALTIHLDHSLHKVGATEAVMHAFGRWVESDARLPDIAFESGGTSAEPKRDGKSTISFARITAPGHERDLAITMTYSEEQSGEIVEADIVINSMYSVGVLQAREDQWRRNRSGHDDDHDDDRTGATTMKDESADCQNRYDVQNIVTHEAGHFFGLGEDPVERDATMFQKIDQCETHKRVLSTTDVAAVSALYAGAEDPEEAAAGPRACAFVGAPAGTSGLTWAGLVVLGAWASRRRRR